ncbi:MAG: hypothetical protein AAGB00_01830 [Planctomycetota bacterium]
MSVSISATEFAITILIAAALLGGLMWRFGWFRLMAGVAVVAQFAQVTIGEPAGGLTLLGGLGIVAGRSIIWQANPPSAPSC